MTPYPKLATITKTHAALEPPGAAFVTLQAPSLPGKNYVVSLLDANNPVMTSGYGGWQLVARHRQVSVTDWQGTDPYRLQFGIILDSYAIDAVTPLVDTVEDDCALLEAMAFAKRNPTTRPPSVQVIGSVPHSDLTYVVESLSWGDAIRNSLTGKRMRQAVNITLLELVEDNVLNSLSPAKTMKTAQQGFNALAFPKTYVVKAGDTIGSIASQIYGKQTFWKAIAKANGIRDPGKIKVGETLKIPNIDAATTSLKTKSPVVTTTSNEYINPYTGQSGGVQ